MQRRSSVQRRRTRRVGICLGVGLRSGTTVYTGFTADLSEGGIFVATHELQAIGTELELIFTLPAGAELLARGIVRWVRDPFDYDPCADPSSPPGMGVQFTNMDARTLRLIAEFVENREPSFFEG